MTITQPLVSYIVPTQGSNLAYLDQCLTSIQKQTYTNIETILCVDVHAAKDNGYLASLSRYLAGASFPIDNLTVYVNTASRGAAATRNYAIQQAKGELIALLDDDDIAYPEKTDLQVKHFQEHTDSVLIGSRFRRVSPDGQPGRITKLLENGESIKKNFLIFFPFLCSTCMIRKEVFEQIGLFDTSFRASEDGDFFYRAIMSYEAKQFYNIPQVLTDYRVHDKSISHTARLQQKREAISSLYKYGKMLYGSSYAPQLRSVLALHGIKFFASHPRIKPYIRSMYETIKERSMYIREVIVPQKKSV